MVSNAQLAASTNGKQYIKAFLSDRSAQLTARLWNASRETFAKIPENSFLQIRGRVENYQNNLQVVIEHFEPATPGNYDIAELLPTSTNDIDAMCQRVFELLGTLSHEPTKAIVQAFLDDEDLMNDFARAPAASSFHHAFVGGLLEHTINMMEAAERLLPLYPGLSRDLVLAGIFLHDIAKTWELSYDAAFGYSDGGQLVGHVVKAAVWIEQKASIAGKSMGKPIPRELVEALQHIVLSHHGLPEHGAARPPVTAEAIFVHLVDNLDAKMSMALSATRTRPAPAPEQSRWTEYLKPFEARLYRPDVTQPTVLPNIAEATPVAAPVAAPPAAGAAASTAATVPSSPPAGPQIKSNIANSAASGNGMRGPRVVTPAPGANGGKPVLNNPLFETTQVRKG